MTNEMKKLLAEVKKELKADKKKIAKEIIRERLLEVQAARRVVEELEAQLTELLEGGIDDIVLSEL